MSIFISARRALVLGLLFVSVFACSPKDTKLENAQETKKAYPKEVVEAFLASCERSSGGKRDICGCLLEKIQGRYSFEEFSGIEEKMKAGETPDDFIEFTGKARTECVK
jgi:hypothetical protein